HPHRNAVLRIGSDEGVEDEDLLVLEEAAHLGVDLVEFLLWERLVDLAPPDAVGGGGVLDDELVAGGAAGVLAGGDHQCAPRGDLALAAPDRFLEEDRHGKVPVRLPDAYGTDLIRRLGHASSPRWQGAWK